MPGQTAILIVIPDCDCDSDPPRYTKDCAAIIRFLKGMPGQNGFPTYSTTDWDSDLPQMNARAGKFKSESALRRGEAYTAVGSTLLSELRRCVKARTVYRSVGENLW